MTRWRKRSIRMAFLVHRWLGVTLGLFMLLWCLSGMVMLWKAWPHPDERLVRLAHDKVHFDHPPVLPPLEGVYRRFRVTMAGTIPVLQLWPLTGESATYDLRTGLPLEHEADKPALPDRTMRPVVMGGTALEGVARHYAALQGDQGSLHFRGRRRVDQWILNTKGHEAGFYRYDFDGPVQSRLYLSPETGDVVQATTRQTRFWSWCGAIPHWLYFSILRRYPALWTDLLISLSGAGMLLTALGLWIGWRRFKTGRHLSPYRGMHFGHHIAGLVFGIFLLSWIATGFLSMNPAGFLAHKPPPEWMAYFDATLPVSTQERRQPGNTHRPMLDRAQLERVIDTLVTHPEITWRDVSLVPFAGRSWLVITDAEGVRGRLDMAMTPAPMNEPILREALAQAGLQADVTLLGKEDAYYFSTRHIMRSFPVWRVTGPEGARLYLDARTGETKLRIDRAEKGSRWLIYGLHDLDFLAWLRQPFARIAVIMPLLAGAMLLCFSGVWIGMVRCLRHRTHRRTVRMSRQKPITSGISPPREHV